MIDFTPVKRIVSSSNIILDTSGCSKIIDTYDLEGIIVPTVVRIGSRYTKNSRADEISTLKMQWLYGTYSIMDQPYHEVDIDTFNNILSISQFPIDPKEGINFSIQGTGSWVNLVILIDNYSFTVDELKSELANPDFDPTSFDPNVQRLVDLIVMNTLKDSN